MSQENQNSQQGTQNSQQSGQSDVAGGSSSGATQQGGASVEATPGLAAAQAERDRQAAGQQGGAGMTSEQISALVKSAVGEVAQQHAPQDPPEVMLAKFNKAFNVYQFDPEKLARLGYSPDQIEAIRPIYEDMRDGFVRQSVTMSNYQIGLLKEELINMFRPALTVAQQQMEEKLKAEFLDTHKDLVGYEPLLEEIKNRYVAQNRQFKSKDELFSTIATEAKAIISKVFAKGGTGTGAGGAGQQQQQSHRMSTVSAGGQGGAGGQSTGTGDKPGWLKALE